MIWAETFRFIAQCSQRTVDSAMGIEYSEHNAQPTDPRAKMCEELMSTIIHYAPKCALMSCVYRTFSTFNVTDRLRTIEIQSDALEV